MTKMLPHNNPLIRSAAPERAVDVVREQLRLSRLAIVSKGFENIHVTGYKTDAGAIVAAMQAPGELVAAEQVSNVVQLRADTAIEASPHADLSQRAKDIAASVADMEQHGQRAS